MKGGMYSGCTIRNTRSVNGWIVKTLGLLLITSLLLTGPGVAKASETSTFSDISGHKYEALIEQAAEDGWVNGCPDGRFWPDRPITRWEYAKMMLAALNIVPGSQRAKEVLQSTEVPKEVLSLADDGWASKEGWVELGFASGLVVLGDYGSYLVLPHDDKCIAPPPVTKKTSVIPCFSTKYLNKKSLVLIIVQRFYLSNNNTFLSISSR